MRHVCMLIKNEPPKIVKTCKTIVLTTFRHKSFLQQFFRLLPIHSNENTTPLPPEIIDHGSSVDLDLALH